VSLVEYLGIAIVPTAWLALALQYTGREKWLTRRNLALLAIEPFVTLLLAWTNELHQRGRLTGHLIVLRDITERKRAEEEIRQRTTQLEALRKVGLELTSQLDLDALLHSIASYRTAGGNRRRPLPLPTRAGRAGVGCVHWPQHGIHWNRPPPGRGSLWQDLGDGRAAHRG
jgi:PAS domain-containing protein